MNLKFFYCSILLSDDQPASSTVIASDSQNPKPLVGLAVIVNAACAPPQPQAANESTSSS